MTTPRTATPAERFAEKTAELTAAMIDLGHAIVAANARQSAHYAAVAEKFGTPFPEARPDYMWDGSPCIVCDEVSEHGLDMDERCEQCAEDQRFDRG